MYYWVHTVVNIAGWHGLRVSTSISTKYFYYIKYKSFLCASSVWVYEFWFCECLPLWLKFCNVCSELYVGTWIRRLCRQADRHRTAKEKSRRQWETNPLTRVIAFVRFLWNNNGVQLAKYKIAANHCCRLPRADEMRWKESCCIQGNTCNLETTWVHYLTGEFRRISFV